MKMISKKDDYVPPPPIIVYIENKLKYMPLILTKFCYSSFCEEKKCFM